jgi:hypothetical protein
MAMDYSHMAIRATSKFLTSRTTSFDSLRFAACSSGQTGMAALKWDWRTTGTRGNALRVPSGFTRPLTTQSKHQSQPNTAAPLPLK